VGGAEEVVVPADFPLAWEGIFWEGEPDAGQAGREGDMDYADASSSTFDKLEQDASSYFTTTYCADVEPQTCRTIE